MVVIGPSLPEPSRACAPMVYVVPLGGASGPMIFTLNGVCVTNANCFGWLSAPMVK
jgi:hypothetical protein